VAKAEKTDDRVTKLICLVARIWSVPIIACALAMFAGSIANWVTTGKADPHAAEDYPFIENLPPIFMFLAILGSGIAWWRERLGGIINLVFCLMTLPVLLIHWPVTQDPRFVFPYILLLITAFPGALFLTCWWRSRNGRVR